MAEPVEPSALVPESARTPWSPQYPVSEQLPWVPGAEKGKIVQAIGAVGEYQGKRQLTLTAPLRILPASAGSVEQFLPRIARKPDELWAWIDQQRLAATRGDSQRSCGVATI